MEHAPPLPDRNTFDTAEGIGNRIGSYHQFLRLVVEPRLAFGKAGDETLRSFAVAGRFYLSGSGETLALRTEVDSPFFAGLPPVMEGEAFLSAVREHGIDEDLWERDLPPGENASIRPAEATCAICAGSWTDDLFRAAAYLPIRAEDGIRTFAHLACVVAQNAERRRRETQEMRTELHASLLIAFGPGEDLVVTTDAGDDVRDDVIALIDAGRIVSPETKLSREDLLELCTERTFRVTTNIGEFCVSVPRTEQETIVFVFGKKLPFRITDLFDPGKEQQAIDGLEHVGFFREAILEVFLTIACRMYQHERMALRRDLRERGKTITTMIGDLQRRIDP